MFAAQAGPVGQQERTSAYKISKTFFHMASAHACGNVSDDSHLSVPPVIATLSRRLTWSRVIGQLLPSSSLAPGKTKNGWLKLKDLRA